MKLLKCSGVDLIEGVDNFKWSDINVLDYGAGALLFSEMANLRGAKTAINYDLGERLPDLKFQLIVSTHCFEHIYDFNINDELVNLSGVNQADVKGIQVSLFCRCESG